MKKEIILTEKAPKAIGPYSVGVRTGNFLFTAGQIGIDPDTGELVPGGINSETEQVLKNLRYILQEAGSGLHGVVKTTVFLQDMEDFVRMNDVYAKYFTENFPARSTVQVAQLPKGAAVEIEAIAILDI